MTDLIAWVKAYDAMTAAKAAVVALDAQDDAEKDASEAGFQARMKVRVSSVITPLKLVRVSEPVLASFVSDFSTALNTYGIAPEQTELIKLWWQAYKVMDADKRVWKKRTDKVSALRESERDTWTVQQTRAYDRAHKSYLQHVKTQNAFLAVCDQLYPIFKSIATSAE